MSALDARICTYEYVHGRRKGTQCGRYIRKKGRVLCGVHIRYMDRHIARQLNQWQGRDAIPESYADDMSVTPSMLWEPDDETTVGCITPPRTPSPPPRRSDAQDDVAALGRLLIQGLLQQPRVAPEAIAPAPQPEVAPQEAPPPPPSEVDIMRKRLNLVTYKLD